MECIILSVNDTYMDAQEVMHMTDYSKITALYSRLSGKPYVAFDFISPYVPTRGMLPCKQFNTR